MKRRLWASFFGIIYAFDSYSNREVMGFENRMEKTSNFPCDSACSRRRERAAHTRRDGNIQHDREAAALSAGLAFPGRLDDSLFTHGLCVLSGIAIRCAAKRNHASANRVRNPTRIELFLVDLVFQLRVVLVLVCLAGRAMGCNPGNPRPLLAD